MAAIRTAFQICLFSCLALSLTGCESMKAARDKIASRFSAEEPAETGTAIAGAQNCPQVAVVGELKNLTQFENPSSPTPDSRISNISITDVQSSCNVTEKTVAVDMGMRFDGQLGPQAAEWKTESHSFAYPYFIAVTTPAGEILSKEIFAATIRYEANEAAITQKESVRQVIPLREGVAPADYEILIGFQLTEDELNYNRSAAATPMEPAAMASAEPAPALPSAEETTPAIVVAQPEEEPVPTTTDGSLGAAPTRAEVAEEAPKPVIAATPAPAEATPAPIEPSAGEPVETENKMPENTDTEMEMGPSANPYAPKTQVIRIKPDGSVEAEN